MRSLSDVGTVLAWGLAALALGCATTNLAVVRVTLPAPLDSKCLAGALAEEPGVRGFRELPQNDRPGYWFEIEVEHASGKHTPGFVVLQKKIDGQWRIDIESSFDARGGDVRGEVVRRERAILRRAVSVCAGAGIEFGDEHVCGKGEKHTVCQEGGAR